MLGTDVTDSAWFGPAVEQLAIVQGQLTSLLTTIGTADVNFSADVQAEVNNEAVITTLLTEVGSSGSTTGSGSTSGSGSGSISGSGSGSTSGSGSMSGSGTSSGSNL
jgi:hypothetical protein